MSIVNTAIAGLPDPTRKIRELWGCQEESNGDGGPYTRIVTLIFDTNCAAGWVPPAMKLINPTLFWVVHHGQQADGTAGAQTPRGGGRSNLSLDVIHPPAAEDMMDDIGEESSDDGETWLPNPRSFPTTNTGFQKFERNLQNRIIRPQRSREVICNGAVGLFADCKQSLDADDDVAWLHKHDHIVNPPAVGSLANGNRTSSRPAAK